MGDGTKPLGGPATVDPAVYSTYLYLEGAVPAPGELPGRGDDEDVVHGGGGHVLGQLAGVGSGHCRAGQLYLGSLLEGKTLVKRWCCEVVVGFRCS